MSPRCNPRFSGIFRVCLLLAIGCSNRGAEGPIPDASTRRVETPSNIVVLTQAGAISGLPGAITFGDPNGRTALFLKFAPAWRRNGVPLAAFLTLEPRAGEPVDPADVRVEVWRVRSAWDARALHAWSDKPELAPPHAVAVTSSSPARTLRIDVTEVLRFAARHPELDQGVALVATAGSGHGASFSTGMSGGTPPQLEIYTR